MAKKLTAAALNKLNNDISKRKEITILGEYKINIDTHFKDSKIDKIVFDYLSLFEETHKNNEIDEEFIRGTMAIFHTFVLREFSDVPSIPKDRNVQKLIQVANALYDTGIMEAVLSEFDQDQLQKVYKKLEVISKRTGEITAQYALSVALNSERDKDEDSK